MDKELPEQPKIEFESSHDHTIQMAPNPLPKKNRRNIYLGVFFSLVIAIFFFKQTNQNIGQDKMEASDQLNIKRVPATYPIKNTRHASDSKTMDQIEINQRESAEDAYDYYENDIVLNNEQADDPIPAPLSVEPEINSNLNEVVELDMAEH